LSNHKVLNSRVGTTLKRYRSITTGQGESNLENSFAFRVLDLKSVLGKKKKCDADDVDTTSRNKLQFLAEDKFKY
jgi:hypothetical protein